MRQPDVVSKQWDTKNVFSKSSVIVSYNKAYIALWFLQLLFVWQFENVIALAFSSCNNISPLPQNVILHEPQYNEY